MTGQKKGFRVPPQGSKKDQIRSVEAEMQNLQMAGRISQMMTQQLMQNLKTMSEDMGSALNQLYELQYSFKALQKHLNVDTNVLNDIANAQRLVDFERSSSEQDAKENLADASEVQGNSVVVITTSAKDDLGNDVGIFRSRLKLSESGVPDLITGLAGKKVGNQVEVKLNGVTHLVELLSIKNPTEMAALESAPSEVAH